MIRTYDELRSDMADQPQAMNEHHAVRRGLNWCPLGAIVGLAGGILAALAGSLLTALSWLIDTGAGSSYLHASGTILLVMTIPLLVFGAHCLDLMERRKDKERDVRFSHEKR